MKRIDEKNGERINAMSKRIENLHRTKEVYESGRDIAFMVYDKDESRGEFFVKIDGCTLSITIDRVQGKAIREAVAKAVGDALELEKEKFKLQKEKVIEEIEAVGQAVEKL